MNKLSVLAKRFQEKLAQVADRATPKPVDPNAGPKDGAEAQVRLDLMKLQETGEAVKADLAEALGMKDLVNELKFTKLRYVDSNGKKAIDWAFAVSPNAAKQFQEGVERMKESAPTFLAGRYIVQLFGQKLPGTVVLPGQMAIG